VASVLPRETWRIALHPLLNDRSPADALAAYYAFHHSPDRTELYAHYSAERGRADGFLVRARTGLDLFRPLVTFRADTDGVAQALFLEGLPPHRPVYLVAPESLGELAAKYLTLAEMELHRIYRFDPDRYKPEINVLLMSAQGPDGTARFEIRSAGNKPGAVAGVNWQSDHFAEVFVHTEPAVRGRGWGKAVVSALARQLLQAGRAPLYVAAQTNEYSIRLAESVGFIDTGYRELVAQGVRPE
jgi:RimJ/RimL family protein N-acetyltransferase